MVPKLHAKRTHFKGTANYLLHDIGGRTNERVAWTEVRNVASRNPDVAWRVMAATSMDQDRLKEQAGVKNTGRKSKEHALHFSLAWHPEEAANLNRQEMLRAAVTILKVMGAEEHQALIVAHNDGVPHVHVLVNRVHPQDGRILSSSFEKLRASKWAEEYEKQRGKIYCEQRVINNEARRRDEFTRGKPDQARHIHDLLATPANDNERRQQLLDEHRRRAFALKEAERQQAARHAQAWQLLETQYQERTKQLRQNTLQQILRTRSQVRERFRPRWEAQYHEQQAALRVFEQRELRTLGRVQNVLNSIDFRSLIGRPGKDDGRVKTISEAFQVISSAGARWQSLQRQQELAKATLTREQKREERAAVELQQASLQKSLAEHRRSFTDERATLVLTQVLEDAKLKAQWLEKGRHMREELRKTEPAPSRNRLRGQTLTQEFQAAAQQREENPIEQETGDLPPTPSNAVRTNPSDLLPAKQAQEVAKQIDEWKSLRANRFGPEREKNKNHEEERER